MFEIDDEDDNSLDGETLACTVPDGIRDRLDRFLGDTIATLSRSRLQALIRDRAVRIDGEICTLPSFKIKGGMTIEIRIPGPEDAVPKPQDIPLNIVYEDDHLLVINKQAGLVVHPGAGNPDGTLVNALLWHCGDSLSGIGGVKRPGIVHRLDKDTSGLMLVAKTEPAHVSLSRQIAEREVTRIYHAFIWGVPQPIKGVVDKPMARHTRHRTKMSVVRQGGKSARTHYKVEKRQETGAAALVECRLETGRTHQIRVHMESIGHPLIGDPLYRQPQNKSIALLRKSGLPNEDIGAIAEFSRQALHAVRLIFTHPESGEVLDFQSEYPLDMQGLQKKLQI